MKVKVYTRLHVEGYLAWELFDDNGTMISAMYYDIEEPRESFEEIRMSIWLRTGVHVFFGGMIREGKAKEYETFVEEWDAAGLKDGDVWLVQSPLTGEWVPGIVGILDDGDPIVQTIHGRFDAFSVEWPDSTTPIMRRGD